MRIAVLGAGLLGCGVAVELSLRGHRVELYDKAAAPLLGASNNNEGKLHLGFVYCNDPTGQTGPQMLGAALRFSAAVRRWLEVPDPFRLSTPFLYGIHRDSMLPPEAIRAHYAKLGEIFATERRRNGLDYPGLGDEPFFEELSSVEHEAIFDPRLVPCAFRTCERAIDPRAFADLLRARILNDPMIAFHAKALITGARFQDDSRIAVEVERDGQRETNRFDWVVNALWDGRLAVDASLGLHPRRPWYYRYKTGFFVQAERAEELPSVTLAIGRYGDMVNYGQGRIYINWYPAGLMGASQELHCPDFRSHLANGRHLQVYEESWAALEQLMPIMRAAVPRRPEEADIVGGIIVAWGQSDIDDRGSELHCRYAVGVRHHSNYVSVDTGKYTTAPIFALQVADLIAPAEAGRRKRAP